MMLSLNLNSDLSLDSFKETARQAESVGYSRIWVGESIGFGHSFPLLALAAEVTRRIQIGAGILSPQLNRCHHIIRAFQTLHEAYGDRFAVALAPGDAREVESAGATAAKPAKMVLECVGELKKRRDERGWDLPIYVGASGPRLIAEGSAAADGILLNYVHPEYLDWAIRQLAQKTFLAAYGPALLLPDHANEPLLRVAARIVIAGANEVFLREFGLISQASEAREALNGRPRRNGNNMPLEKLVLTGGPAEMGAKMQKLSRMGLDEVVLATPMCRNLDSVRALANAFLGLAK